MGVTAENCTNPEAGSEPRALTQIDSPTAIKSEFEIISPQIIPLGANVNTVVNP